MRPYFFLIILVLISAGGFAQAIAVNVSNNEAYVKTINLRAEKIVAAIKLTDSLKSKRVAGIVASQYLALSDMQNTRETKIKAAKEQNADNKEVLNAQVKTLEDASATEVQKQHTAFLSALSKELTPAQVDQVKDGMTYNVVNITYKGYLEEVPELKEAEKKQIMLWLVEAREHAIDAETADKKHAWFGKYKGRINNYLSAAGYDLKKLGEEWQKRIKAAAAEK